MGAWWTNLVEAVRGLLDKRSTEVELDEELAFHVEQETRKHVRAGLAPEEARRRALLALGGVERTKERVREERAGRGGEELVQDLRYAARTLVRNPGYTAVVLLTLALGIGANTAIFSLVSGVLLDPLPYADGDELVYLRQSEDVGEMRFSVHDIVDLRETTTRTLEEVVEYHAMTFTLLGEGEPEEVATGVVSHNFFRALGTRPLLGRDFTAEDDRLGVAPVLLLGHSYWQRRFGGDPTVVGRVFEMNGLMHTVIGVLPPVPQFPDENDVYMPTSQCPVRSSPDFIANRSARMMAVFGRMREGVTTDRAAADVAAAAARLGSSYPSDYPTDRNHHVATTPLKEELVEGARPTLLILLATAGFVLLIACANVANLALARMTRRETELAVRTAMGAGRGRIARQLLTESTLLAVVGAALGLVFTWLTLDALTEFAARFTPRAREAAIDGPVLAFALLAALVTGLGFGALPAAQTRSAVAGTLREGAGQSSVRGRGRTQSALVVLQLAVTVVLLVGAGLLIRSFAELRTIDPGFDPANVLTLRVQSNPGNSPELSPEERRQLYLDIVDRLAEQPGVLAVGLTSSVPMQTTAGAPTAIRTPEAGGEEVAALPRADLRTASPGFFAATRMRLVAGRFLDESDREEALPAAVVSETFARTVWPGLAADETIGRTFRTCGIASGQCGAGELTVVGVYGDVRHYGLDREAPAEAYRASRQAAFPGNRLVVRTASDPRPLAPGFTRLVHDLAPTAPVEDVRTLDDVRGESVASRRLTMLLLGAFAAVALAVSLAGIGGMLAFSVGQRTREIGIRMALGAERGRVLRLVLGRGLTLVAIGLGLGLAGALALSRVMRGLVYGISAADPLTFLAVAGAVATAAGIACWLPARRATRVDPMTAFKG